jgi:hypothetical protein
MTADVFGLGYILRSEHLRVMAYLIGHAALVQHLLGPGKRGHSFSTQLPDREPSSAQAAQNRVNGRACRRFRAIC